MPQDLAGPGHISWGAMPTRPHRPAIVSDITEAGFTLGCTCEGFLYERRLKKASRSRRPVVTSNLTDARFVLGTTSCGFIHKRRTSKATILGPHKGLPTERYRYHEMQLQSLELSDRRVELGLSPLLSPSAAMRAALAPIDMDKYSSPVHSSYDPDTLVTASESSDDEDAHQHDAPSPATAMCAALAKLDEDCNDPFDDTNETELPDVAFGESAFERSSNCSMSPVMSPATAMRAALADIDMDKYSDPVHDSYEGAPPAIFTHGESMEGAINNTNDAVRDSFMTDLLQAYQNPPSNSSPGSPPSSSPSQQSEASDCSLTRYLSWCSVEDKDSLFGDTPTNELEPLLTGTTDSISSSAYDLGTLTLETANIALAMPAPSQVKSHSRLSMLCAGFSSQQKRLCFEPLSPVIQRAIAVPLMACRARAVMVRRARGAVVPKTAGAAMVKHVARTVGKAPVKDGAWAKMKGLEVCYCRGNMYDVVW